MPGVTAATRSHTGATRGSASPSGTSRVWPAGAAGAWYADRSRGISTSIEYEATPYPKRP